LKVFPKKTTRAIPRDQTFFGCLCFCHGNSVSSFCNREVQPLLPNESFD